MKRLLNAPALPLLLACLPLAVVAPARAEPKAEAAVITVTFDTGGQAGAVMAALYDSEAAYARRGAPIQALKTEAGVRQVPFPAVKPGRYAIKAFLDVNGDGKLNLNPMGMPTEPFGFSNGASPRWGEPSWAEASFEAAAGAAAQSVVLR